jgi:hypothetical protein
MRHFALTIYLLFFAPTAYLLADFGIQSQNELHVKYQNLGFGLKDLIIYDRLEGAWTLPKNWQIYLRLDIPYMMLWGKDKEFVSIGDEGIIVPPGSSDTPSKMKVMPFKEKGLADIGSRAFIVSPPVDSADRVTLGFGSEFGFPTAQDEDLGTGKYWARPLAGFKWDFPCLGQGSWFAFLAKYQFSYAGDPKRSSFRIFFVQPVFVYRISNDWILATAPELQYSLQQKAWFIPASINFTKVSGEHFSCTFAYQRALLKDFPVFEDEVELTFRYAF